MSRGFRSVRTRRSERVPFRAAVFIRVEGGRQHFGWSRDLNTGGIHLITDERPLLGMMCTVHITVGAGQQHRIGLEGQVYRCDSAGVSSASSRWTRPLTRRCSTWWRRP